MRRRSLVPPIVGALTLACAIPLPAQRLESRAAVMRPSAAQTVVLDAGSAARSTALAAVDSGDGLPRWVRWGLVGAAAGAVATPLLNGISADPQHSTAGAAVDGAVFGFVIIGGAVALYDAVCGGDTRSRRAVLCGVADARLRRL